MSNYKHSYWNSIFKYIFDFVFLVFKFCFVFLVFHFVVFLVFLFVIISSFVIYLFLFFLFLFFLNKTFCLHSLFSNAFVAFIPRFLQADCHFIAFFGTSLTYFSSLSTKFLSYYITSLHYMISFMNLPRIWVFSIRLISTNIIQPS